MPTNKPAPRDAAEAAAAALRAFWRAGVRSWAAARAGEVAVPTTSAGGPAGRGATAPGYVHTRKAAVLKAAAAGEGMNHDTLAKAWRAGREYTPGQIDELCRLVVASRARFGPTHLTRLMAVTDRTKRAAMTRAAVRGRWGVDAVERAVQAVNGRREHVGRRPAVPDALPDRLAALAALCDKWTRFCAAAGPGLPGPLRRAVAAATAAVGDVRSAAAGLRAAAPGDGSPRRPGRQGRKPRVVPPGEPIRATGDPAAKRPTSR